MTLVSWVAFGKKTCSLFRKKKKRKKKVPLLKRKG